MKRTAAPQKKSIRHFGKIEAIALRRGAGAVVCQVDTLVPVTDDVMAVPVGWL